MRYTFGQAKRALAPFCSAFGLLDIGTAVNTAIDELSRTRNWDRLRRLVRFTVTGEEFALPQDCGPIIRACLNHRPVSVLGTEYEFLASGPGDFDAYVGSGWTLANGIQRVGVYPTAFGLARASRLAAYATNVPTGFLRVRGRDAAGDRVVANVPISQWESPADAAFIDPEAAVCTDEVFSYIDSVNAPTKGGAYLSLYAVDTGPQYLARFHPNVAIPEFIRYRLPGFPQHEGAAVGVLAEVSARTLPLADDDEVLPFDSLLAIQYMLQAIKAMDTGEVETADKYRERAAAVLVGREEQDLEKQAPLLVNSNHDLSIGAMGGYYTNI